VSNKEETKKTTCQISRTYSDSTTLRESRTFHFIGPFPLSESGNLHVIIAVDYFKKWVIVKAIPKKNSAEVVDFFIKRVLLQHGAPLQSDNG
jgi:hypothetical protein